MIQLFTIGFTRKSAERFFHLLKEGGVQKIVDTRIHATSLYFYESRFFNLMEIKKRNKLKINLLRF